MKDRIKKIRNALKELSNLTDNKGVLLTDELNEIEKYIEDLENQVYELEVKLYTSGYADLKGDNQ